MQVFFINSREYLKHEHLDKKGSELHLSGWTDFSPKDIPAQTNSSDCGVFTCMVRVCLIVCNVVM